MSNFDTNAEEFYQRHVRPSLAEYAQYHLCMDYIEVTETMVAAVKSFPKDDFIITFKTNLFSYSPLS